MRKEAALSRPILIRTQQICEKMLGWRTEIWSPCRWWWRRRVGIKHVVAWCIHFFCKRFNWLYSCVQPDNMQWFCKLFQTPITHLWQNALDQRILRKKVLVLYFRKKRQILSDLAVHRIWRGGRRGRKGEWRDSKKKYEGRGREVTR